VISILMVTAEQLQAALEEKLQATDVKVEQITG
jgi:hypothetical protein